LSYQHGKCVLLNTLVAWNTAAFVLSHQIHTGGVVFALVALALVDVDGTVVSGVTLYAVALVSLVGTDASALIETVGGVTEDATDFGTTLRVEFEVLVFERELVGGEEG
jgi:hypothetical protein